MFEILVLLFLNSYLVTGILFVQNLNTGEDTRVVLFYQSSQSVNVTVRDICIMSELHNCMSVHVLGVSLGI